MLFLLKMDISVDGGLILCHMATLSAKQPFDPSSVRHSNNKFLNKLKSLVQLFLDLDYHPNFELRVSVEQNAKEVLLSSKPF